MAQVETDRLFILEAISIVWVRNDEEEDVDDVLPHYFKLVQKYGIIKGSWLAVKRLCRCHPWAKGGYDPVP